MLSKTARQHEITNRHLKREKKQAGETWRFWLPWPMCLATEIKTRDFYFGFYFGLCFLSPTPLRRQRKPVDSVRFPLPRGLPATPPPQLPSLRYSEESRPGFPSSEARLACSQQFVRKLSQAAPIFGRGL